MPRSSAKKTLKGPCPLALAVQRAGCKKAKAAAELQSLKKCRRAKCKERDDQTRAIQCYLDDLDRRAAVSRAAYTAACKEHKAAKFLSDAREYSRARRAKWRRYGKHVLSALDELAKVLPTRSTPK